VLAYGNGRKVGGEVLRYVDVELPDDEDDAATFERLRAKWPLGHLGRVLGVSLDAGYPAPPPAHRAGVPGAAMGAAAALAAVPRGAAAAA
jgi:hypothetical protein